MAFICTFLDVIVVSDLKESIDRLSDSAKAQIGGFAYPDSPLP